MKPHKWTHPLSWFVENGAAMLMFGWIVAFTANRLLAAGRAASGRVEQARSGSLL